MCVFAYTLSSPFTSQEYVCIYMERERECVCVYVCVCVGERGREAEREREIERQREQERERENKGIERIQSAPPPEMCHSADAMVW